MVSMMGKMGFQHVGKPHGQESKFSHRNDSIENFLLRECRSIDIRASASPRKAVERNAIERSPSGQNQKPRWERH